MNHWWLFGLGAAAGTAGAAGTGTTGAAVFELTASSYVHLARIDGTIPKYKSMETKAPATAYTAPRMTVLE